MQTISSVQRRQPSTSASRAVHARTPSRGVTQRGVRRRGVTQRGVRRGAMRRGMGKKMVMILVKKLEDKTSAS